MPEAIPGLHDDEIEADREAWQPRARSHALEEAKGRRPEVPALPAVEALERRMIGAAMRRHSGNKTRAAEDLKVSRRNLIRLVQKYQLE